MVTDGGGAVGGQLRWGWYAAYGPPPHAVDLHRRVDQCAPSLVPSMCQPETAERARMFESHPPKRVPLQVGGSGLARVGTLGRPATSTDPAFPASLCPLPPESIRSRRPSRLRLAPGLSFQVVRWSALTRPPHRPPGPALHFKRAPLDGGECGRGRAGEAGGIRDRRSPRVCGPVHSRRDHPAPVTSPVPFHSLPLPRLPPRKDTPLPRTPSLPPFF